MAITITQQPDSDSHFSAFHPLPIIATSNRANIVNLKATIYDASTSTILATLRKPLDIGTSNQFTTDIYSVVESLVTYDIALFGVHSQCTNSLRYVYVRFDEEYLSGGVLVSGSTANSNSFYVHNSYIDRTDTSLVEFSEQILNTRRHIKEYSTPIGTSDNYFIQVIKLDSTYDHLKVDVVYDDGTTDSFNDSSHSWSNGERWNINVGTHYLINSLGALPNIRSYEAYIADSGNVAITDPIQFHVNNSCSNIQVRVVYLNQRGSFDSFSFKCKRVEGFNVKKEFWTKKKQIGSAYSVSTNRVEVGLFKDESFEEVKLTSGFIKEGLALALKDILNAKFVFIESNYSISSTIGSNLVVNGGFSSSSNWSLLVNPWATLAITTNKVIFTDTTGDAIGTLTQTGILTLGVEYKITAHLANNNGVQVSVEGGELAAANENGTVELVFTATSADLVIEFSNGPSSGGCHFDDVTVYRTANYLGSTYEPIVINDGEFSVVDQVKRENELKLTFTYANRNYNGIG